MSLFYWSRRRKISASMVSFGVKSRSGSAASTTTSEWLEPSGEGKTPRTAPENLRPPRPLTLMAIESPGMSDDASLEVASILTRETPLFSAMTKSAGPLPASTWMPGDAFASMMRPSSGAMIRAFWSSASAASISPRRCSTVSRSEWARRSASSTSTRDRAREAVPALPCFCASRLRASTCCAFASAAELFSSCLSADANSFLARSATPSSCGAVIVAQRRPAATSWPSVQSTDLMLPETFALSSDVSRSWTTPVAWNTRRMTSWSSFSVTTSAGC